MKIKKYKNGGKTPLTAKQKAEIAAEKKRLAAAKRKIVRAKNNQSAVEARKTIAGVNDSLTKNASPMQKELNRVKKVADGMEAVNIMSFANKLQHGNKDAIYFTKKVNGKTVLKGAEDFISDSEQDAEGRYRKGLKKNPDYKYKNGGKMKVKKYKDGGMMDYASGGMLKALLEDPKQREMAKKMLSKNYEGGGMVEYGGGGYMEYDKGGYMSNEQMVVVKADTLEEATKAVKAAVKAGGMTPTHYKVKACFYADED